MTVVVEFKPVSMLDRIKQAKSCDELLALAVEATTYEYASEKTRRKWDRTTQARKVAILKAEKEPEKPKQVGKTRKDGRRGHKTHKKMEK